MFVPPAVLVVRDFLQDNLEVPVYHTVPRDHPNAYVRVTRSGGPLLNAATDKPLMTISCYHSDPFEAELLANNCRAAMWRIKGQRVGDVWVRWWKETGGPVTHPDPDVALTRYQFSGDLFLRIN